MPAGLSLALLMLADVAAAAPAEPAPKAAEPAAKAAERCGPAPATTEPGEIFVCAPRPQGYRINPDVLEAERAKRKRQPKRPERLADKSCASVGPMGCTPGAGINLIGGAIVAATMVAKAIRGENVGSMFVTDPQTSEYELYAEAKRNREAKEAAAAAAAKAKAKAIEAPSGNEPSPGEDE
ncbi:MAG TPA: hypothetical protein VMN38_09055 [Sphingomicrobium sp.]|nr:hypothetical protein [Sphingomicrobium sp.]